MFSPRRVLVLWIQAQNRQGVGAEESVVLLSMVSQQMVHRARGRDVGREVRVITDHRIPDREGGGTQG